MGVGSGADGVGVAAVGEGVGSLDDGPGVSSVGDGVTAVGDGAGVAVCIAVPSVESLERKKAVKPTTMAATTASLPITTLLR